MIWGPKTRTKEEAVFFAGVLFRELKKEKQRRSHMLGSKLLEVAQSTYKIWDRHLTKRRGENED